MEIVREQGLAGEVEGGESGLKREDLGRWNVLVKGFEERVGLDVGGRI